METKSLINKLSLLYQYDRVDSTWMSIHPCNYFWAGQALDNYRSIFTSRKHELLFFRKHY